MQTDARGKRLPCVRLVQIKTIDNCFYQTVSPKARSIGSEAMLNARDDSATATGKRGTAIAVEGLFQRRVTSSPNNPTVIFLRKRHLPLPRGGKGQTDARWNRGAICGGSRGCLVLRKQNRCRFLHRKADLEKIISARKCLHTPCPTTCRRTCGGRFPFSPSDAFTCHSERSVAKSNP